MSTTANSPIATYLGLPERPRMDLPTGTHVSRRVSAFEKNPKCQGWCDCGWQGRERNLTAENMHKAAADCRNHKARRHA
jgi:hypothetical protein